MNLKMLVGVMGAVFLSSSANARISVEVPKLFYSSKGSPLSENVIEHIKRRPVKRPILLYDVTDSESLQLLVEIGKARCGFQGGMAGGFPMLFDGKKCHTSDWGVIDFLESFQKQKEE
jgi:hypothetical protein